MKNKKEMNEQENSKQHQDAIENNEVDDVTDNERMSKEKEEKEQNEVTIESLQAEIAMLNDTYLRLYSEFDNYKRRTLKERIELSKTAGSETIVGLLPILDDFERAIQSIDESNDISALKDGVKLIHNKLLNVLQQKGLEEMKSIGTEFNSDIHEAITNIPASSEETKGKIVDEIEKGYYLNGKVIRYAKVVVGQ